jgi:hypothetical protein
MINNPELEKEPVMTADKIGMYNTGNVSIDTEELIEGDKIENNPTSKAEVSNVINNIISSTDNNNDNQEEDVPRICSSCRTELVDKEDSIADLICITCKRTYPKHGYIEAKQNKDLSEEAFISLKDTLFMCEASLILRKYKEADKYCAKALVIDCRSSDAWAYKAKCYFKIKGIAKIIKEGQAGILPIIRYLNVAKEADKHSNNLASVSHEIATELFDKVSDKFRKLRPKWNEDEDTFYWRNEDYEKAYKYLKIWIECFRIYKDAAFLEAVINELSGYNSRCWIDYNIKDFDELSDSEIDFLEKDNNETKRVDYTNGLVTLEQVKCYKSPKFYFRELTYLENKIKTTTEGKHYKRPSIIFNDNTKNTLYWDYAQENKAGIGDKELNKLVNRENNARLYDLHNIAIRLKAILLIEEQIEFEDLLKEEEVERQINVLFILETLEQRQIKIKQEATIIEKQQKYENTINYRLKEYTSDKRSIQYFVLGFIIILIFVIILFQRL